MKREFRRKLTWVTVVCFATIAMSVSVFLRYSDSGTAEAQASNPCATKPPGASCPDTDNNSCTIARCSGKGYCDQSSVIRPDGTPCSGGAPGCVGGKICSEGECRFRSGGGDPSQVGAISLLDVDVQAIPERVDKRTAFSDCCWFCDEQTLEAIVPTPGLPSRLEADGGLPLRRKFCGTVTRYGVNDELDDPRDIMINILPAPLEEYQNFVAGFVNTEDTPLCKAEKKLFKASNSFDADLCLQTARGRYGRVIHAEVTPDEHFFGRDGRFLPIDTSPRCGDSWKCQSDLEPPNGGSINQDCGSPQAPVAEGKEVCVYGVYALDHGPDHSADDHTQFCSSKDASHDRPEIHPFDAIWWRHPQSKGWMFGVFQDDSNRYSKPYSGDTNHNGWSQGPRDLILRFPFKFPLQSAPMKACLRHVRTHFLWSGASSTVVPMNITTGEVVDLQTQVTALTLGGQRVLEVVKESGSERETYVVVVGRIVGNEVVGQIMLRVAVGAGPDAKAKTLFARLQQDNPLVIYDKDDKGAGYFYGELTFECNCER